MAKQSIKIPNKLDKTITHPLSNDKFWEIYSVVPRLTVEIVVYSDKGVFLTLRDIEPCKGLWHIPGGTVRYGERLTEAVSRVAKNEIGIEIISSKLIGYIEYPSHYLNGLDSPVGIVFKITKYKNQPIIKAQASDCGWFKKLPTKMHKEQTDFLQKTFKYTEQ
ncbi:MAG: NUDIX hydrolase [Candidatus Saccharimonadales bacterium]